MPTFKSSVALATVLVSGLLFSACGSQGTADVKTTTPSSMLGTDSAATKVGGTQLDTTGLRNAPAPGAAADSNRLDTGQ
jgi:ABC-type enterochelin transport system substrate-binding protein